MAEQEDSVWAETVITEGEFTAAASQTEEWSTARDFLALVANGCRTEVVFITEGYHKQQSLALNYQLPELERMADAADLPEPPRLHWSKSANMLNPGLLLERELSGGCNGSCMQRPQQLPHAQEQQGKAERFGVVERCKLLDVQYISKQYLPQAEDDDPFGEHNVPAEQRIALSIRVTLQRLANPQLRGSPQKSPEKQEEQQQRPGSCCSCYGDECAGCSSPSDKENKQRAAAADASAAANGTAAQCNDSSCSGCGEALVCVLEYPVLHLEGNDYIVPAAVFDRGMADWSSLTAKDRFVMLWDGRPCLGFVEGYRRRKLHDSFWGSPWRSITVDWVDNPVDRENDPEDWQYGNPWEMVREARVPAGKVLSAPWTPEGAAAARADALADAAKQAKAAKKRKRSNWGRAEGDFYYEAEDDEAAEISDTSFFFDDDPEDFVIHSSSRRAAARSGNARGSGRPRSGSAGGLRAPRQRRSESAAGGSTAYGRQRGGGGEGAEGEPSHSWGRELVGVPEDVCLVCRQGSERGELVNKHTGHSYQNCCRRYHIGCLLLLNAAGIRTVYLSKQQLKKQQTAHQKAAQGGTAAAQQPEPPTPAPGDGVPCDGLLGDLQQLLQRRDPRVSPALAAAVGEAEQAAELYKKDEVSLACPAHCCHGCGLNGKHEFLVWCCCCWVRTYHCRNCMPMGAQRVTVAGRDYIRCPHCVAANAPLPIPPVVVPSAAAAAGAAATAGTGAPAVKQEAADGLAAVLAAAAAAPAPASAAAAALAAAAGAAAAAADIDDEEQHAAQLLLLATHSSREPSASSDQQQQQQHFKQEPDVVGDVQQPRNWQQRQLANERHGSDSFVNTPDVVTLASDEPEEEKAAAAAEASASVAAGAGGKFVVDGVSDVFKPELQKLAGLELELQLMQQQLAPALPAACEEEPTAAGSTDCEEIAEASEVADAALGAVAAAAEASEVAAAAADAANAAEQAGGANGDVMAALMPDVEELAGLKVELQLLQQQLAELQAAVQQKQVAVEQKQLQLNQKQQKLLQERGLVAAAEGGEVVVAAVPARANRRKRTAAAAVSAADVQAAAQKVAAEQKAAASAAADVAMQDAEDPEAAALFALDMLAVAAEDAADVGADAAAAEPLRAAAVGAAAAEPINPAAAAAAAGAAAAAQMPDERNVAAMPGWLLRSLQDNELHSPSFKLVPLDDDDAGSIAAKLRHVATATARLPNQESSSSGAGSSSSNSSREWGLPLGAPRCFWLLGDLAKAESAKYKVSGSWGGCPIIHVDTPDEGVFGCCIALEHPLSSSQRRAGAAGILAAAAAAAAADDDDENAAALQQQQQQRPRVWLRCWRPVAQDGVQQPRQSRQQQQQQQQGEAGERERPGRLGWDWQVLVNGVPYPAGQGKEGLELQAGDELTVQGVRLKLVAAA